MRTYIHKVISLSVGFLLTGMTACSSLDAELAEIFSSQQSEEDATTRADLITYEINDLVAGTLDSVIVANGYSDAQKLIISGTFRHDDAQYIQKNMPDVEVLDVSNAQFYQAWISEAGWDENVFYYLVEGYAEETVKCIPAYLFAGCNHLKEIILPESGINSLEYAAFYNCEALESINIPETVTYINSDVFYYCKSLKDITLPQNLTYLGSNTFCECSSLKSLDLSMLPESFDEIPWGLCWGCSSLESVTLSPYITKLSGYAFYCCTLTDYNNTFKNIKELNGWGIFQGCKFTEVDLSNIEKMDYDSYFQNCDQLTSVTLPSSITVIPNSMFYGCTNLTEFEIPSNITEIGSAAFANTGLTSIQIPNNVTTIGERVFSSCNQLTSITLPSSITAIPNGMFNGCSSLTEFEISSNFTEIGSYAFSNTGLTSIQIPNNVTTIGERVFSSCNQLTSITFPSSITVIPYGLCSSCTSLTEFTISSNVTEIGSNAFYNSGLTSIHIPENVKTIGNWAFAYCYSLNTVNLSNGLEEIGEYAFSGISATQITLPETLKTIGSYAFESSSLTSLTVPASVTTVKGPIMNYCWSLQYVIWNSSADVWDIKGNSSAYLFIYTQNGKTPSYGPNWTNVIVDGVVDEVNLSGSQISFPVTVTAKKISYTCYFYNYSYNNSWQTIALPFTPTTITSEDGRTWAPFNSNVADAKPFWLRKLTTSGFTDVTTIEPNTGYLISMPYNPDLYEDQYNVRGNITFIGENVTIDPEKKDSVICEGSDYSMYPTYQYIAPASDIYVLNTDYYVSGYDYGSVFVHSAIGVNPYEAYLKNNSATMRSMLTMNNKRTAIRNRNTASTTSRGTVKKRKPQIDDM